MGVTIYDKKDFQEFKSVIKKVKPHSSKFDYYEFTEILYRYLLNVNCDHLRWSEWIDFLKKYIFVVFDENKIISYLKFYEPDHGVIKKKHMKLLIEHLKSIDVVGRRNKEIKEILIKNKNGIYFE